MTEEEVKHIAFLAAQATLQAYFQCPEGFSQSYFKSQSGPAIMKRVYEALAPALLKR